MKRVIDVLLTCAHMNVGLRGHRETVGDGRCEGGNFLAMIKLMAKYDPLIKEIVNSPKNAAKYLSPAIQNEILEILGKECQRSLVEKISPYFSLLLDSTQDITKVNLPFLMFQDNYPIFCLRIECLMSQLSCQLKFNIDIFCHLMLTLLCSLLVTICVPTSDDVSCPFCNSAKLQPDQLSIVIRWIKMTDATVKIEETFLGFIPMQSGTAINIANAAIQLLKDLGLQLEKLRGQVSL